MKGRRLRLGLVDLRWDADSAGEQKEFLGDGFGGGFSEGKCLWIPGGVVDNHQDVFMSPGRLRQWPQKVHSDALEGHLDDGQWYQWAGGRRPG